MFRSLIALALLAAPATALAQEAEPELTLEQRMLLRCSVAFAIVAGAQDREEEQALQYPPLDETGREFFVRALVRVVDETGLPAEAVADIAGDEARAILADGTEYQLMPVCLPLLPE